MNRRGFPNASAGLVLTLYMALSGCSADRRPNGVEVTLANVVKDVVIPIQASDLENPVPDSADVREQGQQIYIQDCALCHGADGKAETALGRGLYPPAMDLTSPHALSWNDAELFWIIQNGIRFTGMPAWRSRLSEENTWKAVRFLRDLPNANASREEAKVAPGRVRGQTAAPPSSEKVVATKAPQGVPASQPKPVQEGLVGEQPQSASAAGTENLAGLLEYGRTLYRQEGCFMCHQLEGAGGTIGPNLSLQGTRGRSDDWLVGHFRDPAAYTPDSIMPAFKNLTDEQLRALVAFLQRQKGSAAPVPPPQ